MYSVIGSRLSGRVVEYLVAGYHVAGGTTQINPVLPILVDDVRRYGIVLAGVGHVNHR